MNKEPEQAVTFMNAPAACRSGGKSTQKDCLTN